MEDKKEVRKEDDESVTYCPVCNKNTLHKIYYSLYFDGTGVAVYECTVCGNKKTIHIT